MARVKSSVTFAALAVAGMGLGGCESMQEFVDGLSAFTEGMTSINNSLSSMDSSGGTATPVGQLSPTAGFASGTNMPIFKDSNGTLFIPNGAGGWQSFTGTAVDNAGTAIDATGL